MGLTEYSVHLPSHLSSRLEVDLDDSVKLFSIVDVGLVPAARDKELVALA